MLRCLLFLPCYCFYVFLLIFCKFLICILLVLMTVIHHHVLLFFNFHINIDKDTDYLQSNNHGFSNDFWSVFSTLVLFLKVWFNKTSNIKLRLFVLLVVYLLLFLHKQIKTLDQHEVIRTCSRHEFLTFDYIDTCEDIQILITQLNINHYSVSKL